MAFLSSNESEMTVFSFLSKLFASRPTALVAKVYAVALVVLVAIAAMAGFVAKFALETRQTVLALENSATDRVSVLARLEDLNRQQRKTVMTTLARPDEFSQTPDRSRLQAITEEVHSLHPQANDARETAMMAEFLALASDAEQLSRTAHRLPPDVSERLTRFLARSQELDQQLNVAVSRRAEAMQTAMTALSDSGNRMAFWISILTAGLVGIGLPLVVVWITRLLRRIRRITRTMHRIADCETSVDVPSTVDDDEVGDLARAVQAFKRSSIALQRNSDEIARLNNWFDLALNNMQRGLSIFDDDHCLVMCNDRYREIYNLPRHVTRPGTPLSTILGTWLEKSAADSERRLDVTAILDTYRSTLAEGEEFVRVHTLPDNRVVVVTYRPLPEGGWVDVHEDVTDRIQTDETIRRLARNDLLTGLRNRPAFVEHVSGVLQERKDDEMVAIVLVDLCNFKRVNETRGHKVGDEVLKALAQRLSDMDIAGDSLARISGDGFGLVHPCVTAADAQRCAHKIASRVAGPIDIDGAIVDINVSVGVALAPQHADTVDALLQRAEIALFQARHASHSMVEMFDPSLENALHERQALESDLKAAFELGQLELHYQPIVDLQTRRVTSFEALMRWRHPTRGMVPPSCFIPLAEELGLIVKFGNWALVQACRDAMSWPQDVGVAVNLSAAQFQSGEIHKSAYAALRESGLPASRLELEVTESLLLRDEAGTRRSLKRLKTMGIRIALDDFGTGYASLSYLRSFPFDKIKIDQTFVRDLPRNSDCNAIVSSVVSLARMLGMRTVAEGIETIEHLHQILVAGCDEVQGYHFSRPVPLAQVADVIVECQSLLGRAA